MTTITHQTEPGPFDLHAYLERIGHSGPTGAPSLDLLETLHEEHVAAIPFENLDILLARSVLLDLEPLQKKMVASRRGGYCFEQNTLFRAALESAGFRATPFAARVRGGGILRPRTHMLLIVDLPQGRFLADVGFGGDGPVRPVPFVAGPESGIEGDSYRLRREKELWVLQGNATGEWTDLYAFTLEPQYPIDFVMANHFTSTYPSSPFVQTLTAQRSWRGRRVILRNRELTVRVGGAVETLTVRDPDHLLEVLAELFGLQFPAGTRFSRPEF